MITILFLFMQKVRKRLTLSQYWQGVKRYARANWQWQCWRRVLTVEYVLCLRCSTTALQQTV